MRMRLNSTCSSGQRNGSLDALSGTHNGSSDRHLCLQKKGEGGEATLAAALSCSSVDRRSSELSEVRQQRWSLLRRHEPAIDHETVRRKNRREVWRWVEPGRSPEERVVVVEHGIERRC